MVHGGAASLLDGPVLTRDGPSDPIAGPWTQLAQSLEGLADPLWHIVTARFSLGGLDSDSRCRYPYCHRF